MASEQDTSVLQVLVDENAKARLLLSSGLAMFIDPSTGWSQSFELKEGFGMSFTTYSSLLGARNERNLMTSALQLTIWRFSHLFCVDHRTSPRGLSQYNGAHPNLKYQDLS
jgi:hypothetical protein